jgi:hypothetical protein
METGKELKDETEKIFINCSGRNKDEYPLIRPFAEYVNGKRSEDGYIRQLEECYVQDKSYQNVQDKLTNSGNSFTLFKTNNMTTIFMRNLVKGGSQWTVRDLRYCRL